MRSTQSKRREYAKGHEHCVGQPGLKELEHPHEPNRTLPVRQNINGLAPESVFAGMLMHVGAAVLMCLFDFRHGRRTRGWLYLPLVLLLALATVLLRYHYVIGLFADFAIAVIALFVAERWLGVVCSKKSVADKGAGVSAVANASFGSTQILEK